VGVGSFTYVPAYYRRASSAVSLRSAACPIDGVEQYVPLDADADAAR